jgi:hypothetical protein
MWERFGGREKRENRYGRVLEDVPCETIEEFFPIVPKEYLLPERGVAPPPRRQSHMYMWHSGGWR